MKTIVHGLPEDLPAGNYDVTTEGYRVEDGEIVIELRYRGPHDPEDPTGFQVTKHPEEVQP